MDLSSAARSEFVRPALTLLVPGLVAGLPYWLLLREISPGAVNYLETHRTAALLLALLALLAAGLMMDAAGSLTEVFVYDHDLRNRYTALDDDWYDYLRLEWSVPPVGQSYLRSLHLHLKFELAMVPAVLCGMVGGILLEAHRDWPSWRTLIWLVEVGLLGVLYLGWQGRNTALALARLRYVLITRPGSPLPAALN